MDLVEPSPFSEDVAVKNVRVGVKLQFDLQWGDAWKRAA
jgi:hypothetical protein